LCRLKRLLDGIMQDVKEADRADSGGYIIQDGIVLVLQVTFSEMHGPIQLTETMGYSVRFSPLRCTSDTSSAVKLLPHIPDTYYHLLPTGWARRSIRSPTALHAFMIVEHICLVTLSSVSC